jgi:hypothetical protein
MNRQDTASAFEAIKAIDYTVIFVRDMTAMRRFYEGVLGFRCCASYRPDGSNIASAATRWRSQGQAARTQMHHSLREAHHSSSRSRSKLRMSTIARMSSGKAGLLCSNRPPISLSDTGHCSSGIPTAMFWRYSRRSEAPLRCGGRVWRPPVVSAD